MHDDALDNLLAASPRLLTQGEPIRLVHPRAMPTTLGRPLGSRTLVGLIQMLKEGWRIVPDAPAPFRPSRRRRRR